MSRNKYYQHLLNSRRWKDLRVTYLREHPLCEECLREGFVRSAIDVHHKTPVSGSSHAEMERLCFDWHNLMALCIPCHSRIHQQQHSHSREMHQQRESERLKQWVERHTRPT